MRCTQPTLLLHARDGSSPHRFNVTNTFHLLLEHGEATFFHAPASRNSASESTTNARNLPADSGLRSTKNIKLETRTKFYHQAFDRRPHVLGIFHTEWQSYPSFCLRYTAGQQYKNSRAQKLFSHSVLNAYGR